MKEKLDFNFEATLNHIIISNDDVLKISAYSGDHFMVLKLKQVCQAIDEMREILDERKD